MDKQQSSLDSLLENLGLEELNNQYNLTLFEKVKSALILDSKPVKVAPDNRYSYFAYPIDGVNDLIEDQLHVIDTLVNSWVEGVLEPMMDDLNSNVYITHENRLRLEINESDYNDEPELAFGNIEAFLELMKDKSKNQVANTIAEWSNTLKLFSNAREITSHFEN